jgi:four helix bundle protein
MANIAEGFGRNGATDFIRYLTISQASTTEVQSHLYVALDLQYIHNRISPGSTERRKVFAN